MQGLVALSALALTSEGGDGKSRRIFDVVLHDASDLAIVSLSDDIKSCIVLFANACAIYTNAYC